MHPQYSWSTAYPYSKFLDRSLMPLLLLRLPFTLKCYCISLLLNHPVSQINRLQLVLNSAARAVTGTLKCHHVWPLFPILKSVHWLTINQIIQYKVLCLTHKCKKTGHPSNLRSLLSSAPHRSTRSSSLITLNRPSVTSGLKLSNRSF